MGGVTAEGRHLHSQWGRRVGWGVSDALIPPPPHPRTPLGPPAAEVGVRHALTQLRLDRMQGALDILP